MKEEQNKARDLGRSSRGGHNTGKSLITIRFAKDLYNLPFFLLQVVESGEVRLLLKLTIVLSAHVIYQQAVADEAIPFMVMVEEDGAEEVDIYLSL